MIQHLECGCVVDDEFFNTVCDLQPDGSRQHARLDGSGGVEFQKPSLQVMLSARVDVNLRSHRPVIREIAFGCVCATKPTDEDLHEQTCRALRQEVAGDLISKLIDVGGFKEFDLCQLIERKFFPREDPLGDGQIQGPDLIPLKCGACGGTNTVSVLCDECLDRHVEDCLNGGAPTAITEIELEPDLKAEGLAIADLMAKVHALHLQAGHE